MLFQHRTLLLSSTVIVHFNREFKVTEKAEFMYSINREGVIRR